MWRDQMQEMKEREKLMPNTVAEMLEPQENLLLETPHDPLEEVRVKSESGGMG